LLSSLCKKIKKINAKNWLISYHLTILKNAYRTFENAIVTSFPVTEGNSFFVNLCVTHFFGKDRLNQGKIFFRLNVIRKTARGRHI